MGEFNYDGVLQVHFVASIANQAAPTVAEIAGGVDLTPFLRAGNTPLDGQTIDSGTADSRYDKTVPGNFGGQNVTLTLTRDQVDADDDAWDALPRGTAGFLVFAWTGGTGAAGALQAGNDVDVWPIEVLSRNPTGYTRSNSGQLATFEVMCSVNPEPSIDVAVAA